MHPFTSIKGLQSRPGPVGHLAFLAQCLGSCVSPGHHLGAMNRWANAQCCQLGIGTCSSCQHGYSAMLQNGVTAPTAHSGHHGNRDEHSYLGPDIHWLHFPDKFWCLSQSFAVCRSSSLSVSLVYSTYDAHRGAGGLKFYSRLFFSWVLYSCDLFLRTLIKKLQLCKYDLCIFAASDLLNDDSMAWGIAF